jgi:hypothetical protein
MATTPDNENIDSDTNYGAPFPWGFACNDSWSWNGGAVNITADYNIGSFNPY